MTLSIPSLRQTSVSVFPSCLCFAGRAPFAGFVLSPHWQNSGHFYSRFDFDSFAVNQQPSTSFSLAHNSKRHDVEDISDNLLIDSM